MQPDPDWQPDHAPQPRSRFVSKLGTYLLGVAIGLTFLGWVQYRKHLASQAAQQQQAEPTTPDPETP